MRAPAAPTRRQRSRAPPSRSGWARRAAACRARGCRRPPRRAGAGRRGRRGRRARKELNVGDGARPLKGRGNFAGRRVARQVFHEDRRARLRSRRRGRGARRDRDLDRGTRRLGRRSPPRAYPVVVVRRRLRFRAERRLELAPPPRRRSAPQREQRLDAGRLERARQSRAARASVASASATSAGARGVLGVSSRSGAAVHTGRRPRGRPRARPGRAPRGAGAVALAARSPELQPCLRRASGGHVSRACLATASAPATADSTASASQPSVVAAARAAATAREAPPTPEAATTPALRTLDAERRDDGLERSSYFGRLWGSKSRDAEWLNRERIRRARRRRAGGDHRGQPSRHAQRQRREFLGGRRPRAIRVAGAAAGSATSGSGRSPSPKSSRRRN